MNVNFTLNGEQKSIEVEPDTPLLWILRDELSLTGTKFGCGKAQCGACTIHFNGNATRSCVMPISAVIGAEITTIEGVTSAAADALMAAWKKHDVPQCGFCQSGQMMSAINLLTRNPSPSDDEIDAGMSGNLCRCATYTRIKKAIREASDNLGERA
ncbi:MAG: (2Fe-2S)-binding protein [Pseudomonadota bacterium]